MTKLEKELKDVSGGSIYIPDEFDFIECPECSSGNVSKLNSNKYKCACGCIFNTDGKVITSAKK